MKLEWKFLIGRQFDAAINMLAETIQNCPDDLWTSNCWVDPKMPPGISAFWYLAYHTLFWMDLYLDGAVEGFQVPKPFDLSELDPAGLLPGRVYSREELQTYLAHCQEKIHTVLNNLSDQNASRLCKFSWGEVPFGELLLDNMRHVQEHGAQLRMFLGQRAGVNSRWLGK